MSEDAQILMLFEKFMQSGRIDLETYQTFSEGAQRFFDDLVYQYNGGSSKEKQSWKWLTELALEKLK